MNPFDTDDIPIQPIRSAASPVSVHRRDTGCTTSTCDGPRDARLVAQSVSESPYETARADYPAPTAEAVEAIPEDVVAMRRALTGDAALRMEPLLIEGSDAQRRDQEGAPFEGRLLSIVHEPVELAIWEWGDASCTVTIGGVEVPAGSAWCARELAYRYGQHQRAVAAQAQRDAAAERARAAREDIAF